MIEMLLRISEEFMFQLVIAEFIFFSFTMKKKILTWKIVVFSLMLAVIYDYINIVFPYSENSFFVKASLCFAFLITLLGYWLFTKSKVDEILFCGVGAFATQNIAYNLQKIIAYYLNLDEKSYYLAIIINIIIMVIVYLLIYYFFVKLSSQYKIDAISRIRNIANSIFILLLTIFFPILFSNSGETGDVLYLLYVLMGDILVLCIQYDLLREGSLKRKNDMLEQILKVGQRQYQMSKDNIEIINMKCHDLRHQISALRTMSDGRMKNEAMKEIEDAIMLYDSSIKTQNETLDIIIMEKKLYCEKNNIKFTCIANGELLNWIKVHDIYSLFGNILDNAIESVIKEDDEKRIISLNISGKGKLLNIHLENYFSGELDFNNGIPITTKSDSNMHGFGMMSVRHILQKYDGNMVIEQKDNRFIVNILIPVKLK